MDSSIENYDSVQELVAMQIRKIQEGKERIIKERLNSIGINIDIEKEKNRRFKTMLVELSDGEETYYYNDGSVDGVRVVTFLMADILSPALNTDPHTISLEIKYY